jgi:hypothetical protein
MMVCSTAGRREALTDLGGEFPITLRVSISMLSVLLVVNDSELDGTEGSMDARCGNSCCLQLKTMSLYYKVVFVVGEKERKRGI